MQYALRPYATVGVALVGASIIAVTPLAVPPPKIETRPVQLVDAWSDLFTDTTENLDKIFSNADSSDITQVFSALFTNPLGVISALTNVDPTVSTAGLPPQVSVDLPPSLELALSQLGAEGATLDAINSVVAQLSSDPSNAFSILYEGTASVLNAMLNGADNVSLLDGIINIPVFNGLLAPEQDATVDINLTGLVNALGLGNLSLSNLDLSDLLNQIKLGDLTVGSLVSDLGLSDTGLGTLLAGGTADITTLSGLLSFLGLGSLGTGDNITLDLTTILTGLGLNPTTDLSSLTLTGLLGDLGLDNLTLTKLLDDAVSSGVLGPTLGPLVTALVNAQGGLLSQVNLGELLTGLTLGQGVPGGLTVGGLLTDLGFPSSTGDLTLGSLLSDLGNPFGSLSITDLLNNITDLNLGSLLTELGISSDVIDLGSLGDLTNLNLGDLLGDLGLGDLASVDVSTFGGLVTELVDTIPAQILAAL